MYRFIIKIQTNMGISITVKLDTQVFENYTYGLKNVMYILKKFQKSEVEKIQ